MIAVGPGAPNKEGVVQAVSVNVGDRVLLPGWGGSPIKVGDDVSPLLLSLSLSLSISFTLAQISLYNKTVVDRASLILMF